MDWAGCVLTCPVWCFYPNIKFSVPNEGPVPRDTSWFIAMSSFSVAHVIVTIQYNMWRYFYDNLWWLRGLMFKAVLNSASVSPSPQPMSHPMLCILGTMGVEHKFRPGAWQENFLSEWACPDLTSLDYWDGGTEQRSSGGKGHAAR